MSRLAERTITLGQINGTGYGRWRTFSTDGYTGEITRYSGFWAVFVDLPGGRFTDHMFVDTALMNGGSWQSAALAAIERVKR